MAKKRKSRGGRRPAEPARAPSSEPPRVSRSEARNEEARAALKPLAPGERPTAVTVGAIVAVVLALANVIAVIAGWDSAVGSDDRARAIVATFLSAGVLLVVAWGMWRAKYWAVLGMQTLLALTLVASTLALVAAGDAFAAIILALIVAAAGTLFWFMVKAMARIQMPERPTRAR